MFGATSADAVYLHARAARRVAAARLVARAAARRGRCSPSRRCSRGRCSRSARGRRSSRCCRDGLRAGARARALIGGGRARRVPRRCSRWPRASTRSARCTRPSEVYALGDRLACARTAYWLFGSPVGVPAHARRCRSPWLALRAARARAPRGARDLRRARHRRGRRASRRPRPSGSGSSSRRSCASPRRRCVRRPSARSPPRWPRRRSPTSCSSTRSGERARRTGWERRS